MNILCVDDELSLLEQTKIYLEERIDEAEVDTSSSVQKAINKIENNDYNIIVSDYFMEPKDGIDLLEELRNEDDHTPFVMFTGKGREEIAMQALNLGANQYVQKGGDPKAQYDFLAKIIKQEVEHYNNERERKLHRAYFSKLFEKSPEAIVLVDNDDIILKANKAFERLFQYDKIEAEGKKINDLIVPEDQKDNAKYVSNFVLSGESTEVETIRKRKDGSLINVSVLGYPIKLEDQQIGAYGIYRDITERKKAEKALKESKKTYESIYQTMLTLANEDDLNKVIKIIADEAKELIDTTHCTVYLVDEKKGVLKPFYSNEPRYKEEILDYNVPFGEGVTGLTYEKGESDYLNYDEDEQYYTLVPDSDAEGEKVSILSTPLYNDDETIGVITLGKIDNKFDDSDVRMIEIFARQAELAIQRAENLEKIRKSKENLIESKNKIKNLHRVSTDLQKCESIDEIFDLTIDAAKDILNFEACSIDIVENDKLKTKALSSDFPLDEMSSRPLDRGGIDTKTYRENKSYIVNNTFEDKFAKPIKEEIKSLISIPLGEIGVFQAGANQFDYFDKERLELAELLISNVSEAFKRVKYENELQKSKQKIEQLHEYSAPLQKTNSKKEIYEITVEAAEEILDFYSCAIIEHIEDGYIVRKSTDKMLEKGEILTEKGVYDETYKDNKSFLLNDIQKFNDSEPQRNYYESGISVPISGFGVFQAVSNEKNYFKPEDLELTELLISHVDNAFKRIESEKEIREKESFYRAIFENTGTATVIIEEDGTISLANSKMNKLLGFYDDDAEGHNWKEFVVEEDIKRMDKYHKLRREDPELAPDEYDFQLLTRDGEKKHVHLTINMIPGTSKSVESMLDVTQEKEALKKKNRYERMIKRDLRNNIDMIGTYMDILEDSDLDENQQEQIDKMKATVNESLESIDET
ncbi:MAG: PAS domain S-box protein [Thermoplasmata archaeon]